jgi:hypothetical protein
MVPPTNGGSAPRAVICAIQLCRVSPGEFITRCRQTGLNVDEMVRHSGQLGWHWV